MRNGIQGALAGHFADLSALDEPSLDRLARTPSAALGSCRYRMRPGDAQRVTDLCRTEHVDALVYIGGNDSAETSHQVAEAARSSGLVNLRVVGVPKTIDNDLACTDHCPGYGSAARFVAHTTREASFDTSAMRATDPIKLVEVMGRHAGWLAGAGWLARAAADDAPHLVYVPERPLPVGQIVADVRAVYGRLGWCIAVLCENQPSLEGGVIGASGEPRWVDAFGHAYYDSPAQWLARELQRQLGVRARVDKPGTIQRMAAAYVSSVDRHEAELVGRAAVRYVLDGRSDIMVTIERRAGPAYSVTTGEAPLTLVANQQRLVPAEFVNDSGNGMTAAFEAYARPLLGEPPPDFFRLAPSLGRQGET